MTDRPVLIHVPVNTGATGREALRKFHAKIFIPQMPKDTELELLTRSVGQGCIIDEFILRLTHMDWFSPGVEPTGRRLAVLMTLSSLLRMASSLRSTFIGIRPLSWCKWVC